MYYYAVDFCVSIYAFHSFVEMTTETTTTKKRFELPNTI